jgi:hypothetical protein
MARDFLKNYYQVTVGSLELSANKAIKQIVSVCEDMDKYRKTCAILKENLTPQDRVLIFVETKKGCDMLTRSLRTDGFEAFLDPLRGTVAKGRLTYRDFALRAGKTAQGTWRNSLVFTGDIDLASKPIRANSIVTAIPLADAANWSKDARGVVDALNAANPELVKALAVGIELYGPLFDPAGKPVAPSRRVKLPEIGDILRDNPGAIIDAAGGIADLFRKKKKDEAPPAAPPK